MYKANFTPPSQFNLRVIRLFLLPLLHPLSLTVIIIIIENLILFNQIIIFFSIGKLCATGQRNP